MDKRLTVLLLLSTLTVMSGAAIAPALPSISDAFAQAAGVSLPEQGSEAVAGDSAAYQAIVLRSKLLLTSPALAIALTAPFGGALLGRVGRLPVLRFALVLYVVAGGAGLWMPADWGLAPLLVSRLLLGAAVAGVMSTTTTLIGDHYEGDARGRALGLMGAFMAGGGIVFLLVGGALADLSWRGPFAIYLLALPLLWAVARFVDEPASGDDPQGSADGFPWIAAGRVYAVGFLGMVFFYLVPTQIAFYLKSLGTTSGLAAGVAVAAATAGGVVVGPLHARLWKRIGTHWINGIIMGGLGLGLAGTWAASRAASPYPIVLASMVCAGLALGFLMPNLSGWILRSGSDARRGQLVGGLTATLFAGQFMSPILASPVVASQGIAATFGASSICLGVFAILCVALPAAVQVRR